MVLGLLARYGPRHGYELRTLIEEQFLDVIADVQFGSIYASLKRLARDGLVGEVGRSRSGNRPERVAFDITEEGRKELRRMLTDALVDPAQAQRPVDLAVHFSALLAQDEVADFLRARLDALEAFGRAVDATRRTTSHEVEGVRALIEDISAHFKEINTAERRWTKRVLRRVEAGGYPTPGRTLDSP